MSEIEAVVRLRRGDRTALEDLFNTYSHPAVRLAYVITGNQAVAEDTVQEAFILWAAVAQLDETYRLPIVLRYFIRLSEQEIAEALGIPPGTVKSRLHTARRTLHERLASENGVMNR